ncbi:MAG TPA: hypothetical protein VGL49_04995 [Acidimicrobiales bacterium]
MPPPLRLRESIPLPQGSDVAVGVGAGGQYLVVPVAGRSGPCWVCAPASDRAVACVRTGETSPWTVLHHSATGTVDIYRTLRDGSVRESVVLCARLPLGRTVLAAT